MTHAHINRHKKRSTFRRSGGAPAVKSHGMRKAIRNDHQLQKALSRALASMFRRKS